jgi:phage terminase large subunit-like protein
VNGKDNIGLRADQIPGVLRGQRSTQEGNRFRREARHYNGAISTLMSSFGAKGGSTGSMIQRGGPVSKTWLRNAVEDGTLDIEALTNATLTLEAIPLHSYTARAHRYVREVLTGERVAGVRIKQLCARHAADLKASREDPTFPYEYDPVRAGRACLFVECLPHVKGKWARDGDLITLEGWQALFVCMLFGWVRKSDGARKHSLAILFVGRKNAKSSLAAALALYMLGADGEEGPEVLCGATSELQAEIVFDAAKAMLLKTPELVITHGLVAYKIKIVCPVNNGTFVTMIGKPGDGTNPHFAVVDEYHEHPTDEMVETMRTGMGSREQPILLITTTAGDDISLPCYSFYQEVCKVLDGSVRNDALLAFIFEPDKEDEWDSDEAMAKANPNLGVSVFKDHLIQMRTEAIADPRKVSVYKRKHLNIWVNAGSPWVNSDKLLECSRPALKREDHAGYTAGIGIDLSSKNDLTARVACVRVGDIYRFFCNVYLPAGTVDRPENVIYRQWRDEGWLTVTPGAIVDIQRMVDDTLADSETLWRMESVRFDPYNAQTMVPQLEAAGLTPVEVPQTVKFLSDPMKWLAALIDAGKVEYDGNPIFAWCMSNVEVQPDRNDNLFPRRNGARQKIDVAVAAIMAFMAIYSGDPEGDFAAMLNSGVISG